MKWSGGGIRLSGLCLSALCAPGLSLILVLVWALAGALFDTASPANEITASLGFAIQTLVALAALIAMVTLWGLIPSCLFGAMGCWLAERTLRSGGWWMWGLAGLLTAGDGAAGPAYGDTGGHWAEGSIGCWSEHGME